MLNSKHHTIRSIIAGPSQVLYVDMRSNNVEISSGHSLSNKAIGNVKKLDTPLAIASKSPKSEVLKEYLVQEKKEDRSNKRLRPLLPKPDVEQNSKSSDGKLILNNVNAAFTNEKQPESSIKGIREKDFQGGLIKDNPISTKERVTSENKSTTNMEFREKIANREAPTHPCPLCEGKYFDRLNLYRHISVHLDLDRLICLSCGKHMNSKKNLKRHFLTSHGEKKKETCHICQQDFLSLWYHNRAYHDPQYISSQPIQCEFCPKTFTNTFLLSHHVARHPIHQVFTCGECNATFGRKETMKDHIVRWHLPPSISCPHCPKMFYASENLNNHLWTEHAINKKKLFMCDVCGKVIGSIECYRNHLATHTNEKHYMCTECGKKFRTRGNLSQHARTHSDRRPYSCDICQKSFRIRNHLKQHMAVHDLASTSKVRKRKRGNKRNESVETSSSDDE